jgi:hypothetical protein
MPGASTGESLRVFSHSNTMLGPLVVILGSKMKNNVKEKSSQHFTVFPQPNYSVNNQINTLVVSALAFY